MNAWHLLEHALDHVERHLVLSRDANPALPVELKLC